MEIYIEYEEDMKTYVVKAEFKKIGKTKLIIESPNGDKNIYEINIGRNTYDLEKK